MSHYENVNYSCLKGRYKERNFFGSNNPNYGNHILSERYKNNPKLAKEKLSRPKEKNGRSVKIELYDKDMNYVKTFSWIGGCAEYLIDKGFTKSKINYIRDNISTAAKNNTIYLNHYYKKIA